MCICTVKFSVYRHAGVGTPAGLLVQRLRYVPRSCLGTISQRGYWTVPTVAGLPDAVLIQERKKKRTPERQAFKDNFERCLGRKSQGVDSG